MLWFFLSFSFVIIPEQVDILEELDLRHLWWREYLAIIWCLEFLCGNYPHKINQLDLELLRALHRENRDLYVEIPQWPGKSRDFRENHFWQNHACQHNVLFVHIISASVFSLFLWDFHDFHDFHGWKSMKIHENPWKTNQKSSTSKGNFVKIPWKMKETMYISVVGVLGLSILDIHIGSSQWTLLVYRSQLTSSLGISWMMLWSIANSAKRKHVRCCNSW